MPTTGTDVTIVHPSRGLLAAAVLRRTGVFLASLVVTFMGLTAVTFFISRLTNIDPVIAVIGDRANQATYERVARELGLDQPPIVQYLIYLKRLVTGDFGMSVLTSQPVLSDLLRVFPATFELATIAILIGVVLGVPAGVTGRRAQGTLAGSSDPGRRALRLLGAGVLAWPGGSLRLLRQARLGWRAPAGSTSSTRTS